MAEQTEYTGGGYASSGWHETGLPRGAATAAVGARAGAGEALGDDGDERDGAPAASLRDQIEDLTDQAREETLRLAADARAQLEAVVRRRQELVADRLAGVAAALRDAGRRLQREAARPTASITAGAGGSASARPFVVGMDDRPVGIAAGGGYPPITPGAGAPATPPAIDAATRGLVELAERAAQQVDRASRYMRSSEIRDVVRDVEDLARRRPAAFVGGSFAAGLLLARFFKSSGERRPPEKLAGRL
jgi:ElaB/YqjD/DUF883 family membrane-anchored ribosome-binding protein